MNQRLRAKKQLLESVLWLKSIDEPNNKIRLFFEECMEEVKE